MHHRNTAAVFVLVLTLLLVWSPAAAKIVVEPGPSEIPTDGINIDDEELVPIWTVPPMRLLTYYTLIYCPALAVPVGLLYSFSTLAFLGYRRASRQRPSENTTRRQIFACIRENPGISIPEIAAAMDVSRTTVNYHLFRLQRRNLVHRNIQGNTFGYFAYTDDLDATEEHLLMHLKNRTKKDLLALLLEAPGISQSDAAEAIEVSRATVSWHMKRLIRDGLVEARREGRTVHYRLTDEGGEVLEKEMENVGAEEEMGDAGPAAA
ncbi:winged helix-turn-helix transcriptional regulator [Methanofollis aquaemaris]|uniref:Winged helix-turn-helix transcriptional regulator n=1 Tax=Methanofollis aquaemaris TaxID=126734 RepID=A0A8A3S3R5_9EURY|nr:winged helix-turn-helix transcriptional regulator [Methanofollis aquaemaris]QSZ66381.1 winged helix-turn-helix transcriptional regulator [Methanofollis aquaemaris]